MADHPHDDLSTSSDDDDDDDDDVGGLLLQRSVPVTAASSTPRRPPPDYVWHQSALEDCFGRALASYQSSQPHVAWEPSPTRHVAKDNKEEEEWTPGVLALPEWAHEPPHPDENQQDAD